MTTPSQKRALKTYRRRLSQRGLTRFEVQALASDRALIRAFAKRLLEGDDAARELRASVRQKMAVSSAGAGGIVAALRRSPLVGAELDLRRPVTRGRKIRL